MGDPVSRRKRRYHAGAGWRLLVVLFLMVGLLFGLRSLVGLADGGKDTETANISPVFQTPVPTPTPTPSPVPTPSMEPLPNVDVNDWSLRLIRYEYPLGEDFAPPSLTDVGDGQKMDSRVSTPLQALMDAAKAAGFTVYVCSGYRDYDDQYWIYWNHVEQYEAEGMTREEAESATRLAVNYPGCSEHQSGLAVDLLEYEGQEMEPYIGGSGLMLWLEEHCADYGFVVRYPKDKTDLTGVEYEPWHLRYVGAAAPYMMSHGLCLEEFLGLYT